MKHLWRTLFARDQKAATHKTPRSMQELRGGDLCWCGSEKPYRKCHRPEDRKRQKELGINRRKSATCDAFT
mgnify:CR=1 FL=1